MPTSRPPLQVLILADERDTTDRLILELTRGGFDVEAAVVTGPQEFRDELAHDHDLILAHHGLPGLDAFEALGMLRSTEHDIPLVAFGGSMSQQELAECLRLGAAAHLPGDDLERLVETVQRVLDDQQAGDHEVGDHEVGAGNLSGDGKGPAETAHTTPPEREPGNGRPPEGERGAERLPETRLTRLQALRRVDLFLAAATDLRRALASVAEELLAVTGAGTVAFWIFDGHNRSLRRYAGVRAGVEGGPSARSEAQVVSLGEGAVGRCALAREPLRSPGDDDVAAQPAATAVGGWRDYAALPMELDGRLQGVVEVASEQEGLLGSDELAFLEEVAAGAAIAVERSRRFRELERRVSDLAAACDATIEAWARALDLRDDETAGHSRRVTDITVVLARHMGLEGEELANVRRGALLHDVGKLGVADSIFTKPGALTADEREDMQRHPELAKELLEDVDFLQSALAIPWCHHENWDGSGYPRGLKGEEIPLPARIFAVCDVYDALTSARPYRSSWTDESARRFIEERSGRQFDPRVVAAFLEVLPAVSMPGE